MGDNYMSRRDAAWLIAQGAAGLMISSSLSAAEKEAISEHSRMLLRTIPSSGEKIPAIGLGTWQVFDVGPGESERRPLEEVLARFSALGGRLVDSSPMYGRAEQVIGELAAKLKIHPSLFLATKVWTTGREQGVASMERSLAKLQTRQLDLMQVHNLVDARTHLATLRGWKEEGRIRYLGVTHYTASAHQDVARLLQSEKVDFLQINYSILEREAADALFPVAQDKGIAVLANRPFGGGNLFGRLRGKPLPEWAAEFDCKTWAQFLLKWIVAHPAVTCAIPATSKVAHLEDNMQAGIGRLPDAKMRQRMVDAVAGT
ncbi:MAG TPA: aldo/keto reductase [Chthoniobacterales bacterium]|jgi:diketogulonate reductase-like aldo/keto reductase|nr:aldo/keto reductase [Chthoniobacterales bacterium]